MHHSIIRRRYWRCRNDLLKLIVRQNESEEEEGPSVYNPAAQNNLRCPLSSPKAEGGSPRPSFLAVRALERSGALGVSSYRTEPIPVPSQKLAYEQMQRSLGRARSCGSSSSSVGGTALPPSPDEGPPRSPKVRRGTLTIEAGSHVSTTKDDRRADRPSSSTFVFYELVTRKAIFFRLAVL